jgi:hypothetical protein
MPHQIKITPSSIQPHLHTPPLTKPQNPPGLLYFLIICNTNFGGMIAAICAARTSNKWITSPVVWTTVCIKDSSASFRVEQLITEFTNRLGNSAFNVGLVNVDEG